MTGEGRAGLKIGEPGAKLRAQRGGAGGGGFNLCAETFDPFTRTNLTVVEGMHQFTMFILYVVQPVRGGRNVRG